MAGGLVGVYDVVFGLDEAEEAPGEFRLVRGAKGGEGEAVLFYGDGGRGGGLGGADGEGAVPDRCVRALWGGGGFAWCVWGREDCHVVGVV